MKKIVGYGIVSRPMDSVSSIEFFLEDVRSQLDKGLQPLGTLSLTCIADVPYFVQAMVKYEEESK